MIMKQFDKKRSTRRGAAMMVFVIFFFFALLSILVIFTRNMQTDVFVVTSLAMAKQSYFTNEAALEDGVLKIMRDVSTADPFLYDDDLARATTTVTYDVLTDRWIVRAVSQAGKAKRIGVVELARKPGTAFNYGLQSGNGGFHIGNNSELIGNAFSNGIISGQGNADITGDVISAGPSGAIQSVTVEGSARANTIHDSTITGDAYYNNLTGSNTIDGTSTTPYTVDDPEPFPISNETLDEWQDHLISNGDIISGSDCAGGEYVIDDDTMFGPAIVECDLNIRGTGGGTEVSLRGPVWVQGNLRLTQGPDIKVSPYLQGRSVPIIAHDPNATSTKGIIEIRNTTEFFGEGGYIFLISRNDSAVTGGSESAIEIGNRASGDVALYTNEGMVDISNNIDVVAVTGYQIELSNASSLEYEAGMQNVFFAGGPGSIYDIVAWYQE